MAKSDTLTLRINHDLKTAGNSLLETLGLSPSSFISMAYSQLVQRKRVPFEVEVVQQPDLGLSQSQFDRLISDGDKDIAKGDYASVEEVFVKLDKKYGL